MNITRPTSAFIALFIALLAPISSAQAQIPCRSVVSDGKAVWVCAEAAPATLPATSPMSGTANAVVSGKPFRGRVTYKGTYSLTVEKPVPQQNQSQLRIGGLSIPISPTTTTEQFNGAITFIVEYDGFAYTVTQQTTGVLGSGRFSGVVSNGVCETTASENGNTSRTVAQCNTEVFSGSGGNLPGSRQQVSMTYNTRATEVIDYDVRDAQRAQQAVSAQAQQERARAEQAKADKDAGAGRILQMPQDNAKVAQANATAKTDIASAQNAKSIVSLAAVKSLWERHDNALPLQVESAVWKAAETNRMPKLVCISGDCQNGYGVAIGNDNGWVTTYQLESFFRDGKQTGIGVKNSWGGNKEVVDVRDGASIFFWYNVGLPRLYSEGWLLGFELAAVQAHHAKSFRNMKRADNCMVLGTKTEGVETTQGGRVIGRVTTSEKTVWFNECKTAIYVKSIQRSENAGVIFYYDTSFALNPKTEVDWERYPNFSFNAARLGRQDLGVFIR
jgi:hypothetical protein